MNQNIKKNPPVKESSVKVGDTLDLYDNDLKHIAEYEYKNAKWINIDDDKPLSKKESIYLYRRLGEQQKFINIQTYSRIDTGETNISKENLFDSHDYDHILQPYSYLLEKIETDKNGKETKTLIYFIDLEKLGITKKTTRLDTDYLYDLDNQ